MMMILQYDDFQGCGSFIRFSPNREDSGMAEAEKGVRCLSLFFKERTAA